ncbi:MAG: anaerobic sulfatase maturase [Planctomycetota bacterium]
MVATSFHVLCKPIGSRCNLDCDYCFYLEKGGTSGQGMSERLLERFVKERFASRSGPAVSFLWQGGEPTLLGVAYFRRAVELQERHCPPGVRVENAIQTNGILLDDEWARFLAEQRFLVGVSVDGPEEQHDPHRVDRAGRPSLAGTLAAIRRLVEQRVAFNTLSVIHRENARRPLELYQFLKRIGATHLQFIPLVVGRGGRQDGVPAEEWGAFLIAVFDEWLRSDLGKVSIQLFEEQLGLAAGRPAGLCVFAEICGGAPVLEQDGDLYSCDHFVDAEHRLGNILEQPLAALARSRQQLDFGRSKSSTLPEACRCCEWLSRCFGECPKNRDAAGLNRLCAGYRSFFEHSQPRLEALLREAAAGQPERIPGRNDPCPCGSGLKFKRCHGRP